MRVANRAIALPRLRASRDRWVSRVALSPLSWGVSDVRGWGPQLDAQRVLGEMAALGEPAMEAGPPGFLPDRSDAARPLLKRHGLRMVAGPVRAVLHHHDIRASELAHIDGHAAWLGSLGAHTLILSVVQSHSDEAAGPELSRTAWAHLLSSIGSVQHVCAVHKLRLAVQPRQGSVIQGPAEIERLLVGSEAGVCVDVAQLVLSGADPVEIIELAAGRIQHVHMNDIDRRLAEQVREARIDYPAAVARGLFKPLGTGDGDAGGVVEALDRAGYRGWIGLESEVRLESVEEDPLVEVRISLEHLRSLLPSPRAAS